METRIYRVDKFSVPRQAREEFLEKVRATHGLLRSQAGFVEDAILEMTGTTTWFSGKATCVPFLAAQAIGHAGDWRMVPLHANGQLAAAAYHLGEADTYHPFAIVVVATTTTHLTRISLFAEPALFPYFELPATMTGGRVDP